MELGEKMLALTLEYRNAIEGPALAESVGQKYTGRTTSEIGAEYENALRAFLTA